MKASLKKTRKFTPLFLSIIIPGLGQLTQKQWKKGLFFITAPFLIFGIFMLLLATTGFLFSPALLQYYILHSLIIFALLYILQLIDVYQNITSNQKKQIQKSNQPKNHPLALILSLLIPGLGQLTKKQITKGLLIISAPLIYISINLLVINLNFVKIPNITYILIISTWITGITLYLWQLFDAYKNN